MTIVTPGGLLNLSAPGLQVDRAVPVTRHQLPQLEDQAHHEYRQTGITIMTRRSLSDIGLNCPFQARLRFPFPPCASP
jgi:hypothetical protein